MQLLSGFLTTSSNTKFKKTFDTPQKHPKYNTWSESSELLCGCNTSLKWSHILADSDMRYDKPNSKNPAMENN